MQRRLAAVFIGVAAMLAVGRVAAHHSFAAEFDANAPFELTGNVTKIAGAHNIKAGLFVEHTTRPAQRASTYNGTITFNSDGSNPLNTNVGYANALIGAISQYQESDGHPEAHGQFMNTEWYVQDNWRVKQNFTIDAGLRFYYLTPAGRARLDAELEQWQRLSHGVALVIGAAT